MTHFTLNVVACSPVDELTRQGFWMSSKFVLRFQFQRYLCLGFFVMFTYLPSPVHASESKLCKHHFFSKQYERAAACFAELAQQIEIKSQKLSEDQKTKVVSFLRNASLAWRRSVKKEKDPLRKLFLYERALQPIERILVRGYYENTSQRRLIRFVKARLLRNIGYVQVSIVTDNPKATIEVSGGFQFKAVKKVGIQLKLRLRAGTYTVIVKAPKQVPQSKLFKVQKSQQPILLKFTSKQAAIPPIIPTDRVVTMSLSPEAKRARTTGIVLASIGSAALVASVVLVGLSVSTKGQADEKGKEFQGLITSNPGSLERKNTLAVRDGIQSANEFMAAGVIAGMVAVVAGVSGIILYGTNANRKAPTQTVPKTEPGNKQSKPQGQRMLSTF